MQLCKPLGRLLASSTGPATFDLILSVQMTIKLNRTILSIDRERVRIEQNLMKLAEDMSAAAGQLSQRWHDRWFAERG
jgi:hypothetical protein